MKKTVEYDLPKQVCRSTVGGRVEGAVDAFPAIDAALERFRVGQSRLADDGYIGIPLTITVYTDPSRNRIPKTGRDAERIDAETEPNNLRHPKESRRTVLYPINLNVERIGTDSDETILLDLLSRGFHVAVLDYHHELRAKAPDLDWSIQGIRCAMEENGSYLFGLKLPKFHTYVVPEGYTLKVGIPYFHYFEHGVDGIDDFIVDIWNTALHRREGRFAKGERFIVRWGEKLDENFRPMKDENREPIYKKVTPDAVWEDEEKRLIKVCYTVAEHWWDCVKATGEVIDPHLYLDLTYPTHPRKKVPVMTCHSSSEERNDAHVIKMRPTMTGYLLRGYAAMTFDHAYTPMAKTDHLGYFEGDMEKGRRTDFTLRFVTGMGALTAPIRLLRKLAELYPEEYAFDEDAIGSYGHSKGAPTNILATAHPELLPPEDYLPGRHGECAKPQPFSHYENGDEIPSGLNLAYTSNGGGGSYLFSDQCPTVVTQGESDGPFHSSSHYGAILSTLRSLNVPTLDMSMPKVGHTTVYGYSEPRDFDMYNALFEFSDYYLKGAPSVCEYILPRDGARDVSPTDAIRIKFSGEHTKEEIERAVSVKRADGSTVNGRFLAHFKGNEWTFLPEDLTGGERVTVSVDGTLKDRRGNFIRRTRTVTYTTEGELRLPIETDSDGVVQRITLARPRLDRRRLLLRLCARDSVGRIGVYLDGKSSPIATSGTAFDGCFEIDLTEKLAGIRRKTLVLTVKPLSEKPEKQYRSFSFDKTDEIPLSTLGGKTYPYDAPNSYKPPRPIGRIEELSDGPAYSLPAGVSAYLHDAVPLKGPADLGRLWRIDFDAMSPEGRSVHAKIVCRDDPEPPYYMDFYSNSAYLAEPKAGEWQHCSFTYAPNDAEYLDPRHKKSSLTFLLTASARLECDRLYLRNLKITELGKGVSLDPRRTAVVLR